jgi:hypothetical protein
MRSGRATVGEPRKNDDPERTRDQKRRSNSSANADPEPIGDRTRIEEPGLATNRLKANSSARASQLEFRISNGEAKMRVAVFVVFVVAGLWVGDKFFFKGQYTNGLSTEVDRDVRDFGYTVRRWTSF